jgi:hypothetical protein
MIFLHLKIASPQPSEPYVPFGHKDASWSSPDFSTMMVSLADAARKKPVWLVWPSSTRRVGFETDAALSPIQECRRECTGIAAATEGIVRHAR